jgi:hypothetical protein
MVEGAGLIFREEQKFGLRFAVTVILLMMLLAGISIKAIAVLNETPDNSIWIILLIVVLAIVGIVLPISVSVLLLLMTLETEVHSDGLYVRFFPIHINYKKFSPDDLERYHARQYKPLREYGGWGIRFGRKNKVYSISGDKSVQILLKNGERVLLGSQKPYELVEAINTIMKKT